MNGEPDALEGACPVRGGEAGKRLDRALPLTPLLTDEGWLYLALMIDLYNREVVGWAMGESNDTALTLSALDMALDFNNPPEGLLHHSDRGSNYTAKDYRQALSDRGI